MSNVNRFSYGTLDIINVPVDSAKAVEIGDFACRVSATDASIDTDLTENYATPADQLADAGDAAANRERAADQFLGVFLDAKVADTDEDVNLNIGTAGFFRLTQETAAAIHVGDGIEIHADADAPSKDEVVEGDTSKIAVCTEHKTSTTVTEVLCRLLPSKLLGQGQA